MNMTIPVPEGSTNHGNPHLLCVPPRWYDFIIFFGANYFAHAATVISLPGQSVKSSINVLLFALAFPVSGMVYAIRAIRHSAILARDPIERATRAGAIVMVTRTGAADRSFWGDIVSEGRGFTEGTAVYGNYYLPPNYDLRYVAREAPITIDFDEVETTQTFNLPSTFNIPKLIISLVQVAWALVTIYRSRGDQIEEFGYATFGLTVVPYAFMSIVNIFGNLLTPDYPSVFLIRTPIMEQAEQVGGSFPHALKVKPGTRTEFHKRRSSQKLNSGLTSVIIGLVPLVVVGALSGFRRGHSTPVQRGFTMTWTVVGILIGPLMHGLEREGISLLLTEILSEGVSEGYDIGTWCIALSMLLIFLLMFVPCIGGMVVVGQMIQDFGVCTLLA